MLLDENIDGLSVVDTFKDKGSPRCVIVVEVLVEERISGRTEVLLDDSLNVADEFESQTESSSSSVSDPVSL